MEPEMKNRVRELRNAKGITQPQLAKELGVSLATIQNWEAEKTDMTGYSLAMLCDFFHVSPSQVYGDGEISPYWEMQVELLDIFQGITEEGKRALLATARGLKDSYAVKNNSVSDDKNQELTA